MIDGGLLHRYPIKSEARLAWMDDCRGQDRKTLPNADHLSPSGKASED